MKMTIEIPDTLYERAKIHAGETEQTLEQIVLLSLRKELDGPHPNRKPKATYWANRKLLPEFEELEKSGVLKPRPGDKDVTEMISEDREDRYR